MSFKLFKVKATCLQGEGGEGGGGGRGARIVPAAKQKTEHSLYHASVLDLCALPNGDIDQSVSLESCVFIRAYPSTYIYALITYCIKNVIKRFYFCKIKKCHPSCCVDIVIINLYRAFAFRVAVLKISNNTRKKAK